MSGTVNCFKVGLLKWQRLPSKVVKFDVKNFLFQASELLKFQNSSYVSSMQRESLCYATFDFGKKSRNPSSY